MDFKVMRLKKGMYLKGLRSSRSYRIDSMSITNDGYNAVYNFLLIDIKNNKHKVPFSVFSYETLKDLGRNFNKKG